VGIIKTYTSACGYEAEIYEGAGFVVTNALRECGACKELVSVPVSARGSHGRPVPPDAALRLHRCPRCGSDDLAQRSRLGARRSVACPRCGDAMRVAGSGRWD
jgi:predicted RNA-binding Zn-ribbon protein involved in translation (DUF1610 family)